MLQIPRRFARDDWGGTEQVILETSKELLARGHETEIVCTNATAPNDAERIDGVLVTRFPYFYPYLGLSADAKRVLDKKGGSPFSFALMRGLRNWGHVDLFHLHCGNRIGGIARREALRRKVPYVVSLHGGRYDVPPEEAASREAPRGAAIDLGKPLGAWVGARRVLDDAAALICVGYREAELARDHHPDKLVVHLPNGVDAKRFAKGDGAAFRRRNGIPADAYVLITVARIDVQKNQLMLAKALPKLRTIEPRIHLVFVGAVTNQEYLATIEGRLAFDGTAKSATVIRGLPAGSTELVDAYHAADAFVLPSIHEPFGIAILEAWAAGLPVLASKVGGIPYFVEDGKDGLLFESDHESSFVEAAQRLMRDPALARQLASRGKEKAVGRFSWQSVTDRLIDVYQRVLT